jgi:hypothetical protein
METAETHPEGADGLPAGLAEHCRRVARAFVNGEVVPFLGAGANLCGRSGSWKSPGASLPSGRELAHYLAREFDYPLPDRDNLIRVTQYQATMEGPGPLYKRLREVFLGDYGPTPLHDLLAQMPKRIEESFGRARNQLVVTTNYDDSLEQAFRSAGQPFDLFTYIAWGDDLGKFLHTPADGEPYVIPDARQFADPILDDRHVILKIHGAVDRSGVKHDSFVITEDHYIDFLQRTAIEDLIPMSLLPALQQTHFLFLGYSLADWNLRVMLQRIWQQQDHGWNSWAVQHETSALDQKFWTKRGVDIVVVDLLEYVPALGGALEKLVAENAE